MAITIKTGKDVLAPLQSQLDNLELRPNERQTGIPTVFEFRLQLPKDPATRAMIEEAVTTSLELATSMTMGQGSSSSFVGGALRQVFDALPKDGFAKDILLQIASVPVRTDFGSSYAQGITFRGFYKTESEQP